MGNNALTLQALLNAHIKKLTNAGKTSGIDNQKSRFKKFRKSNGFTLDTTIEEVYGDSKKYKEVFDKHLNTCNGQQQQYDHKCTLDAFKKTAQELLNGEIKLEGTFQEILVREMKKQGFTYAYLAEKLNISRSSVAIWCRGNGLPDDTERIKTLERILKLPSCSLLRKIGQTYCNGAKKKERLKNKKCALPFRKTQGEATKDRYRIDIEKNLPLGKEWNGLRNFMTNDFQPDAKRNKGWRVRKDGCCGTADIKKKQLDSYFGFAKLPMKNDPYGKISITKSSGLGLDPSTFSLASLANADNVINYCKFRKARASVYNHSIPTFVNLVTALLREETGYVWQNPQIFAQRFEIKKAKYNEAGECVEAAEYMKECEWQSFCVKNRQILLAFLKAIGPEIEQSRKPFEPIKAILDKQHPILVIEEMLQLMNAHKPSPFYKQQTAVHKRDTCMIAFLRVEPLRARNVVELTWRADNSGQLYQDEHGAWWERIPREAFKNWRDSDDKERHVMLSKTLWPYLDDYIFNGRPVLLEPAASNRVTKRRTYKSDRVFLNDMSGRAKTIEMSEGLLSEIICRLSCLYVPEYYHCCGFRDHAFRHICATEHIKNHPEGYEVAARILHDKVETVRKAYAHLKSQDVYSYWTNYIDDLIETHNIKGKSGIGKTLTASAVKAVKRLLAEGHSIEDIEKMV